MNSHNRVIKMTSIYFCIALFAAVAARAAVSDYVSRMPAQNAADRDAVCKAVLDEGAGAIGEVCAMLAPTGAGDDNGARYLLSGLSMYVMVDKQREPQRKLYATAVADALGKATDKEVKQFLMAQLQMVGKDECVPAVAAVLSDDDLCRPAVQALCAVNTPGAADALAKALPNAQGLRLTAIINALGDMKVTDAASAIAPFASNADAAVRDAALSALEKLAPADKSAVFEKAVQSAATSVEKGAAYNAWLAYAENLAAAKDKAGCESICRKLMVKESPSNIQCAALGTLVEVNGKDALPDLLKALDSDDAELRGAALLRAAEMDGGQVTKEFVAKLDGADPGKKIAILDMLTRRGDDAALPAALDALDDQEMYVRLSACRAATMLGDSKAVPNILSTLQKAENADEITALKDALLRTKSQKSIPAVVEALDKTPPTPRKALLEVIAARGEAECFGDVVKQAADADEGVRTAALKTLRALGTPEDLQKLIDLLLAAKSDAEIAAATETLVAVANKVEDPERRADKVVAAMQNAGDKKPLLIKALAGIGGKDAFEVVFAGVEAGNDAVKDASLRALADWPTMEAAPVLLDQVKKSKDETQQVLALRGYIRLAGLPEMAACERAKMIDTAIRIAKRPDEKTMALGALGAVHAVEALQVAEKYFDDKELKGQAAVAAVKIAVPGKKNEAGLIGPEVMAILKKAEPLLTDEQMKKDVRAHLDKDGFTSVFNGEDLTGWVGDTNGYKVEDGVMICKPGGNLYTAGEYKDFVFRFEFKLTQNANNGLGIRAPLTGDSAYQGMEIQILDDSGPEYMGKLQPYQFHGSIYGIVPAKQGFLKPVGEWNSEEVTVKGRQVTVKLNGEVTVDADLDKAVENGTMDHKEHPGLKNEKGHIGFLGHGSVLEFRNMMVKEL